MFAKYSPYPSVIRQLEHVTKQFDYRVTDILLKLIMIKPNFAVHMFQYLNYKLIFIFNLLDSCMTGMTCDI
jgi:hypothetical protein